MYTVQAKGSNTQHEFLTLNNFCTNLKYAHLTPNFRQHNIHLVFSTYPNKYNGYSVQKKTDFERFQDL